MRRCLHLVLALGLTAAACRPADEAPVVVRVPVASATEAARVAALLDDEWTETRTDAVLGLVSRLDGLPNDTEVVLDDLDAAIAATTQPFGAGFYEAWSDLDDLHTRMEELAAEHDAADVIELGTSHEGRPILALRIARRDLDVRLRPSTLVTGGVHAREWVGVHAALYIAERLLVDDGVDPAITEILDTQRVVVVPVVNPDGYRYTWTTDRLWRKNRRDNGDGSFGVDLNRNFAVGFGQSGSSGSTTSNNYRGPSAISEPESVALADFLDGYLVYDRTIDLHCTGQLVLAPWAFTGDPSGDDDAFVALAADAAAAMTDVEGTDYGDGLLYSRLYPAAGTWVDHAYGTHGSTSLLLELRDRGAYGFLLPAEQLLPTAMEAWAAVRVLLEHPPVRLGVAATETAGGDLRVRVRRVGDGPDVQPETEVWLGASVDGPGTTVTGLGPDLELANAAVHGPYPVGERGEAVAVFPAGTVDEGTLWQAFTASARSRPTPE